MGAIIPIARHAGRVAIADKGHAVCTGLCDVTTPDRDAAVVIVHEYGVAADLIQKTILDGTILSAVQEQRAAAIRSPIAPDQRLLVLHERARRVTKRQPAERDKAHWRLFRAAIFNQVFQADGFDCGFG